MAALLNSSMYGELGDVSASAVKRTPGKFYKMFVTGKRRPGQTVGMMQAMYEVKDNSTEDDYIINNADEVLFICYFTKRWWEKNIYVKVAGEDRSRLVAFGWEEDVAKIDDQCRFVYCIAAALVDKTTKKIMLHKKDVPDAEIKKGDPILIYFRCDGTKFSNAVEFLNKIGDKAKSLPPLSDNPDFEKKIVAPRRFICSAKVGSAASSHGDKDVFLFDINTQLPDKAVEAVMNNSVQFKKDFEKQFNKSEFIKSGNNSNVSESSRTSGNPTFDEPKADESVPESAEVDENFDLGI